MGFDEFTRQAPIKQLAALAKFAERVDITVLQFSDEAHPLFQQQRESRVQHKVFGAVNAKMKRRH